MPAYEGFLSYYRTWFTKQEREEKEETLELRDIADHRDSDLVGCFYYARSHTDDQMSDWKLSAERTMFDVLRTCPDDERFTDVVTRAWSLLHSPKYSRVLCTVSGGSDSTVMADLVRKCDTRSIADYVWFNTGCEYKATQDYIRQMEKDMGIAIQKARPKVSIPESVRKNGVPFLSKRVSDYIGRLQQHGFQWEDKPLSELLEQYCRRADEEKEKELDAALQMGYPQSGWAKAEEHWYKGCVSALRWWTDSSGEGSHFNISRHPFLKEFLMESPPEHKISSKCCKYAKKDLVHALLKEGMYDLNIYGVRKAEGGDRATSYKSCFSPGDTCDSYRILFFVNDKEKERYIQKNHLHMSRCYYLYGLIRTGCVGCPFGHTLWQELAVLHYWEPKFYKLVENIFGWSYEYTEQYRRFRTQKKKEAKKQTGKESEVPCTAEEKMFFCTECRQMTLFDFLEPD